ncbi:glucose 1-dehydrogenase [Nonomuraea sp. NPDC026600]|uniref:SDR family NAD(P)-dependent oxidoreductase n=1 Tax=Nonomuraea sp. NPDC026600 TaxID=3155363 RepID=UPI003408C94D
MGAQLDGMTFVITGAARGMGAATARMAASRGAAVVVADLDDVAGARTVEEITEAGGRACYQHCDVTDADQVRELMRAAAEAFGGIDVLHNNAGIHETMLGVPLSIEEMPLEAWDRVMAVNLRGSWLCAKFAVPYLKGSTRGPSIINCGSSGSLVGGVSSLAYGASKGGVALLTKNLAVELARYGIRVNCYCPSATETRMVSDYLDAGDNRDERRRMLTRTQLVGRIGTPDDIAALVCFLASGEAAYVNGVVWLVDGGSLAWRGTVDTLGLDTV